MLLIPKIASRRLLAELWVRSSRHALRAASEQTALKDCTTQDPDVFHPINFTRRMQMLPIEDENRQPYRMFQEGIGYL